MKEKESVVRVDGVELTFAPHIPYQDGLTIAKRFFEIRVLEAAELGDADIDLDMYGFDYMRVVGSIASRQIIQAVQLVRMQALRDHSLRTCKMFAEACRNIEFRVDWPIA
jgi:hypothetical protein